ncbi:MAG: transposase [Bifidobacterium longum]
MKKAQRNLSRKRKGSNRCRKARAQVARLYARVANLRSDALNKTTAMLAHAYAYISIEDLNVEGMAETTGSPIDSGRRIRGVPTPTDLLDRSFRRRED